MGREYLPRLNGGQKDTTEMEEVIQYMNNTHTHIKQHRYLGTHTQHNT